MKDDEKEHQSSTNTNSAGNQTASTNNVVIMGDSGKPFFWRRGRAEDASTMCGIVQAILASASASGLRDLLSLRAENARVAFMTVGALTLVSVSGERRGGGDLLARLQLEYLYGRILFALTRQVQAVLAADPNFDLGEALEPADAVMRETIDDLEGGGGTTAATSAAATTTATTTAKVAPYLTGSTDTIGPIPRELRQAASMALLHVYQSTPNTVFSILMVGERLLSLVQPSYLPHQLCSSDLRLLLKFIHSHQSGLSTSELWLPVCLPRFNAAGFLYAYSTSLHATSQLSLVLVSHLNSTHQFQLFRTASIQVRKELGLPLEMISVLRINTKTAPEEGGNEGDVAWKRLPDDSNSSKSSHDSNHHALRQDDENADDENADDDDVRRCPLLAAIHDATVMTTTTYTHAASPYVAKLLKGRDILHFIFRKDVQVKGHSTKECGVLPQCFSPPLPKFKDEDDNKARVWSSYQSLCMRLRLGSASTEAWIDWYSSYKNNDDGVTTTEDDNGDAFNQPRCTAATAAMALTESVPKSNCVTYVIDGAELFLAMNGRDFELYTIFPSSVPIKSASASAAKLARTLVAESSALFLMEPLTWKD